jgi:hypothetical protein
MDIPGSETYSMIRLKYQCHCDDGTQPLWRREFRPPGYSSAVEESYAFEGGDPTV